MNLRESAEGKAPEPTYNLAPAGGGLRRLLSLLVPPVDLRVSQQSALAPVVGRWGSDHCGTVTLAPLVCPLSASLEYPPA